MEKNLYNLTSSQNAIWLTEQLSQNTNLNNISGYVFINQNVNFEALEKALNLYVQKNDALNFRFILENGTPKQYLADYTPFKIDLISVASMEEIDIINQKIADIPFSFFDSTLYRMTMFKLPDGRGGFNATLHHFISDSWNMGILINEVIDIYSSLLKNENICFEKYPSYIDFIDSEKKYFESSKFQKDKDFWAEIFNQEPQLSYISSSKKSNIDTISNRKIFKLDSSLYKQINSFCKENRCSIYTFFMAIYAIYTAKINNIHTSIIGTPVLNRSNFKEKNTAGMFISTVPFKIDVNPDEAFNDFLIKTSSLQREVFRHQKYPYQTLLEDVKKKYDFNENLYDFVLSYQNARDSRNSSNIEYSSKWLFTGNILDSLQIHFYDMDDTGILYLYYDYQVSKFSDKEINSINNRIMEMAEFVLDNPHIILRDINIVTKKEQEFLLGDFNYIPFEYNKDLPLVSLFEEQVIKNLNKTAVTFEDSSLTYSQLNEQANKLANFLIKHGTNKNDIIGIMLPRSLEVLVAIWAVLKSGAGYMLIDTTLPSDRISYMLSNANSNILITNSSVEFDFKHKVLLDEIDLTSYSKDNPKTKTNNEDTFCVIYTSGSTGLPKGVELKKSSIINMLYSYKKFLHTDTCDTFLSTSTVAFDMFIVENFVSLLSGKTVILANDDQQKVPAFMSSLIQKYNVDFILSTPSKIELLLLNDSTKLSLKNVKVIQLGGEVFKESLYKKLRESTNAYIFNGYGPSECTACCSNKEIENENDINIGKAFLNTHIYILNSDMNLLPIGYTGELCVSGFGVGKGYINNPSLTNKSFVLYKNSNQILYKTGDLAKYNENGELIYCGRRDSQIKLHGLRIELSEISNKVINIPDIINAICVIKKVNNIDCICCYVMSNNDSITEDYIKDKLREKLPYYMIPSHVIFLDNFPITLNGKLDLKKLPNVNVSESPYVEPSTDTELILYNIFQKVLDVEKVSINSNFFELGGDSLASIKLISEIYSYLNMKISIKDIFEYPTISLLAKYLDKTSNTNVALKIDKAQPANSYPLSSAQERIYYTVQLNKNSVVYNTPGGLIFDKVPDIDKLETCFNTLINSYDSLRTYFITEDENVVQKVLKKVDFKLIVKEAKSKNKEDLFNEFVKPFNLEKAPLFKAILYTFEDNSAMLLIDMHHIICDGESIFIFIDALCKLYNNQKVAFPSIDYIDYTMWEKNQLNSNLYKKSETYWLQQFEEEIPILNMPTNFPRSTMQSFEGAKIHKQFMDSAKIYELCNKLNTTPYMLLLSVYYILLYKYTSQNDIIIGSPIIGRDNNEINNIIGMFVNTLPLKIHIDSSDTFKSFLKNVSDYCINSFENQTYPFNDLLKKLNITRDPCRNPLFDTMFIYQNNGKPDLNFEGLISSYYIPDNKTSKFDFSLEISNNNNVLDVSLEYCTKLFTKEFMESFLQHYFNILNQIINNIEIPLLNICLLTENNKQKILCDFNCNKLNYPSSKTIIELFEEQVSLHPDSCAVTYKNETIDYQNLKNRIDYLSAYLIKSGIKKGDIVPTFLPKSIDLIISLLAIMKCGAIYLPISVLSPDDRINYIIKDSNSKFIITNSYLKNFDNMQCIFIDKLNFLNYTNDTIHFPKLFMNDIIYTIYTSGSTGTPKGVQITNKNLVNFIYSFKELFDNSVKHTDICLSTTNISFDVSIWEFFFTLLNGATLYLYEKENIDDIFEYCNTIIKNNITMTYIPPNILNETYSILSENKDLLKLEKILVGVEPIKTSVIMKFFTLNPNMKIINGYGPTETTICTTAFKVLPSYSANHSILPIGKPLHNMKAYVLDKYLNPLPINVPGELYVSGDNVGYGYLNNLDLTNKKYIISPFDSTQIMYNTGDIVKWLPDGNLMFVGRNDKQVKLHGYRIDLTEISRAITDYPTIIKSITIVKENNNNKSLVAFFTASEKIIINDLRSFLSLKLPSYCIPNFFIQLEKFELTSNGKINFNSLLNTPLIVENVYEAPRNDFEEKLADLWQKILNIDKIGINDNFFELGGDSLIAIKLQIEAFRLGLDISYSDIFTYPTIKQLSNKIFSPISKIKIKDFNFNYINNLIKNNSLPIPNHFAKTPLKNILLTGVTGFVGIHILDSLLSNTSTSVYCLIRNKDNISYTTRLQKTLQFYFGDKYDNSIGTRIKIVEGDITKKNLGLSINDFNTIGNDISCVINAAAIVKHYGKSSLFNQTNVDGVKNIISFCKKYNLKLYHISTLSVSGNVFAEDNFTAGSVNEKITFREDNLFVNQDLSNKYIYTKFIAEKNILDSVVHENLSATIIRLGNITSRFSDGKFQINFSENAFLNRLISFIQLKSIPDYLFKGYVEFTPVDCCANAISSIIQYDFNYTILHLFNNNHVSISNLISILNEYGLKINVVKSNEFLKIIDDTLKTDKNILSGIINDFDTNKKLVYDSNITLNNSFTNEFLEKIYFVWPNIDKTYIFKYLDYLKDIGYIDFNMIGGRK